MPGPAVEESLGWAGAEPIRATLTASASGASASAAWHSGVPGGPGGPGGPDGGNGTVYEAVNFRAYCSLDASLGAALPTVDVQVAGKLAGRLAPTRRTDGVVSVFSLLLDTPVRLRAGETVAFVLTPSSGAAATGVGAAAAKTLCSRLEVYAQPPRHERAAAAAYFE